MIPMKTDSNFLRRLISVLLLLAGLSATPLLAQQRGGGGFGGGGFGGGGFGGGGGGGGQGNNRNSGSGSYNLNGQVGSALISVDPQTHNIVVITDTQTSLQISNVIANLDIPKPQVLIKVVFMEVQRNNASDVGVEGSFAKNNIGNGMGTSAGSVFGLAGLNSVATNVNGLGQTMGTAIAPSASGAGTGGLYQIAGSDFQATLRAIATAGKAQVLSRPSIIARDGQLARIVVGQQVPLPSGVSYATSGGNTIPIINVSYNDVGIILNVTPFIGANGLVEMIVQPQISSVSPTEKQALSADVSAPYVNVRSADTVVVTPDSQTVVIGGLISNSQSSTDKKVPILGDIPLLGNLFKSKAKSDSKTELLIFLTPHIIQAPTQLAALTAPETRQTPLITNSVSERELDRFLERVPAKK
jgi:general secretion pathway protein D